MIMEDINRTFSTTAKIMTKCELISKTENPYTCKLRLKKNIFLQHIHIYTMCTRPPNSSKCLHVQSIPDATREELDIDELALIGEYNKWSIGYFLNSYFLLSTTFGATGHNLYTKILQSLNAMKEFSDTLRSAGTRQEGFLGKAES